MAQKTPRIETSGNEPPVLQPDRQVRLTGVQRIFWIIMVILSGAYILFPLDFWPEMVLGLVGLLDDGVAGMVLLFSLSRLGIRIPLLDRFVNSGGRKNEKSIN